MRLNRNHINSQVKEIIRAKSNEFFYAVEDEIYDFLQKNYDEETFNSLSRYIEDSLDTRIESMIEAMDDVIDDIIPDLEEQD